MQKQWNFPLNVSMIFITHAIFLIFSFPLNVWDPSLTFPQPVPPCVSLRESVQVYKEHCRMAREFHQVKHEIGVLEERK